jgi:membrane fusion protein, multidrug efflux system
LRAQAELARSDAARARKLLEVRAISQEEHDQRVTAEAQVAAGVRAAEAALAAARLNLEFTQVRSPIDGRAGRARVTTGNLVNAGSDLLTTVVSLDPVYVSFDGDEQAFLRSADLARRGGRNTVNVGLAHEDGYPHEGRLDFVDNQVDPATGTIRLRAVLNNGERRFTPGLFARVRLQGNAPQTALLIDERAILTDQDRKYVYVLGADHRAERRDILLGRMAGGLRIVSAGLSAGDRVIVHGVQKVFFPGMPVQPQIIAMGEGPRTGGALNGIASGSERPASKAEKESVQWTDSPPHGRAGGHETDQGRAMDGDSEADDKETPAPAVAAAQNSQQGERT